MTLDSASLPHILVVDDSSSVRRTLERQLSPYMRVTLAENVPEALAALTHDMQLVLSDILMPGESGFDLAATLRRDHPDLPVVLFTGVVDTQTRAMAQAVGVETVLRKPLCREQLLKLMHEWLGTAVLTPTRKEEAHLSTQPEPQRFYASTVPAPQPEREITSEKPDFLLDLSRLPGVLSAALFNESGEWPRQLNLPLPGEAKNRVLALQNALVDVSEHLGSALAPGVHMQVELKDRLLLLGQSTQGHFCLVVRDGQVAQQVKQHLRKLN